ncbi:hypothetical protein CDAR_294121 [Caerostris darwini]|uniref:Uncharacterized protein n=1 Tax=Caerostris darwini TaxID=1538125 RepID=A0AAV4VGD3_9ARAC|nr:hypothetical protein CDAR_294121 [Caerostris darwini]
MRWSSACANDRFRFASHAMQYHFKRNKHQVTSPQKKKGIIYIQAESDNPHGYKDDAIQSHTVTGNKGEGFFPDYRIRFSKSNRDWHCLLQIYRGCKQNQ